MIRPSWREASSLIIVAKSNFLKHVHLKDKTHHDVQHVSNIPKVPVDVTKIQYKSDYNILMLRRSDKNSLMPGSYVFPGGAIDSSDTNEKWLQLYNYFGFKNADIFSTNIKSNQTPIFQNNQSSSLPKALSLRITAIRETFEECGILLCKHKQIHNNNESVGWSSYLTGLQIQEWQKKIKKDPHTFINLCKDLECFPDVWTLHQWSNWLSPTTNKIRFDTAFFIAMFDQLPPVYIDNAEMDDMKWCTPDELIENCKHDKLWLPPPQFYEVSRLRNFETIHHLAKFAALRQSSGCERWMPVQVKTFDGVLTLLPGDDIYPIAPDAFSSGPMNTINESMAELRKTGLKLNRMEIYGKSDIRIVCNIDPSDSYVLP